jgi:hypothetical protein
MTYLSLETTRRANGDHLEVTRPDGEVFLTPVEMGMALDAERQRAEASELRAAKLAERLHSLGIDPDDEIKSEKGLPQPQRA